LLLWLLSPLPPLAIRRSPSLSGVPALVPGIRSNAASNDLLLAAAIHPLGLGVKTGSTSEPQAGQWNTPSGKRRISG